ncbi:unnamed protein product, partial [Meganyctiphanes norvegica]
MQQRLFPEVAFSTISKQLENCSRERLACESMMDKIDPKTVGLVIASGVGTVALATVALPAFGFGAAGIAAGSTAAGMMSSAAVANGGGVAAGGAIAACQSAGVLGMAASTKVALGSAGAGVGAALNKWWKSKLC